MMMMMMMKMRMWRDDFLYWNELEREREMRITVALRCKKRRRRRFVVFLLVGLLHRTYPREREKQDSTFTRRSAFCRRARTRGRVFCCCCCLKETSVREKGEDWWSRFLLVLAALQMLLLLVDGVWWWLCAVQASPLDIFCFFSLFSASAYAENLASLGDDVVERTSEGCVMRIVSDFASCSVVVRGEKRCWLLLLLLLYFTCLLRCSSSSLFSHHHHLLLPLLKQI